MTRRFHAERLNIIFGILTVAILLGAVTVTVTSGPIVDDTIDVGAFVATTFDGYGYADYAGGSSSIESTLNALELLSEYDLIGLGDWEHQFDEVGSFIRSLQESSGGFKENVQDLRPNIKTTAQCLKALNMMGELDDTSRKNAYVYLSNYFKGGLNFDSWITDGVFEIKYWGLVAAEAIGNTEHILGLPHLSLSNVKLSDERIDDGFTTTLVWGAEHFSSNSKQDIFKGMSFDEKLLVVDTFELLISQPDERSTIINLLVNTDSLVEDISRTYDEVQGLFVGGSSSLQFTANVIETLDSIGRLGDVLSENPDNGKVVALRNTIQDYISNVSLEVSRTSSVTKILAASEIASEVMPEIHEHTSFTPVVVDETIIGWKRVVQNDFVVPLPSVYRHIPSHSLLLFVLLFSVVVTCTAWSVTVKNRTTIGILALILAAMFVAEVGIVVYQASQQVPQVPIDNSEKGWNPFLSLQSANMMWTSYIETTGTPKEIIPITQEPIITSEGYYDPISGSKLSRFWNFDLGILPPDFYVYDYNSLRRYSLDELRQSTSVFPLFGMTQNQITMNGIHTTTLQISENAFRSLASVRFL